MDATAPLLGLDDERCYRAVLARDRRFDGWFFVAVRTTGIYCRPSCSTPILPKQQNVSFHPTAASAQQAGYRACKRCRPDATPGSPAWNVRADLVGRAMRLIADGAVDRQGVTGLAGAVGVSERHLHRLFVEQVGAPPVAVARAQRAQTARVLAETTDLPLAQVAFAAGFGSVRQFNDTVREVFATAPGELRRAARRRGRGPADPAGRVEPAAPAAAGRPGAITVRLPHRTPLDGEHLFGFLGARAVAGIEAVDHHGTYRRSLRLGHGPAVVELSPAADHVTATFHLAAVADLAAAIGRVRRLLDLDADPEAIATDLRRSPGLARAVARHPGLRSPGAADAHELAVRAVLGQQVSVAAARTHAARLVAAHGELLGAPVGPITRTFPDSATLAGLDPDRLGLPRSRGRALVGLAEALADGRVRLDPGVDRHEAAAALEALPGIGPWTAAYVRLRALADPDAFLPTDLGVRRGAAHLGLPDEPARLRAAADDWRPWRSYALHHLWAAAGDERGTAEVRRRGAEPPARPRTPTRRPQPQEVPT